ncbi:hypothetical protein FBF27_04295 [Candidatus Saccharibacteria bacterium oral taxon 488]|nr:hypothetical protein FBF27_04295 [Candidatus Saccharibacteria bacterium oral taxon 488]
MIGATSTAEVSSTVIDGDGFDVFSSLRGGAGGEDFSSGIDETVADNVEQFDLVAVASGEEELPSTEEVSASIGQTACVTCVGCPYLSQCVKPQALAMKRESERQENISTDINSAGEEAVPNLMEMTPKESYLERLLAPDDFDSLDENGRGELVMAEYSEPIDYQESIIKNVPEPAAAETKPIDLTTKTDEPTEQIVQQERETKTSTNEPVEVSGEDMDTEAAEAPFFGLKMAPETIADDIKDVGESRPESASEISDEGYFTGAAEASNSSTDAKPRVIDATSDADDDNKQPTLEPLYTPAQAETAPASLAINEGNQTVDKNSNPLENEAVYHTTSDDKGTASVVKNTYDGDENTAPSSVKTPSIEHQKEKDFVITGSKSANSEPSRVAENDESATPVSEQQHLAAQFEAIKVDEPAATDLIDDSGTKVLADAQSSEINIDVAADYNNFVESTDGVDVEQPKHVIPTVTNMPPSQAQEDAVNVSAEYETSEVSTKEVVNATASISAKEQPDQSAIVSLSTQDVVEYGEDLLSASEEPTADHGPTRPDDVINMPTTHEVIEATHEADETIELEAVNVTLPAAAVAVSEGKSQIDLPPELSEELVVDQRIYEVQTSLVEQLDHNHAAVECDYDEDDEVWAEEDTVFFVEQQSPAVEPEVSSAEAVTVAPMETIIVREEYGDLKLSVDDEIGVDMDSVGQSDNFKTSSVPEITNDYETVEQIAIPVSPATEPIPDVELDEPTMEISEERIMPREEHDSIVMEVSEKSDLPRVDDEVEAIITDTSDVEPTIDLLEEQEELAANEVSEAVESELDEQNDLAVDSYGYNSETSTVSDNVLVVKSRQSPGLWPDDSRLNPEEESASMAQSSADDTSLVSRLVGMFVVAMCVVRGRQSVKV